MYEKILGSRIKQARKMEGLSLRRAAEKISVSHQSISNYEKGIAVPDSQMLLRLGEVYNVNWEYFLRPKRVENLELAYRKKSSVSKKDLDRVENRLKEWLERYLELEELFPQKRISSFPSFSVKTNQDIEEAALKLREEWELGMDSIDNLIGVLEDQGVKIGLLLDVKGLDAAAFWTEDKTPVIAIKEGVPGDRQRFSVAHELGHLVLGLGSEKREEDMANRFAGAFLVPAEVVKRELGKERKRLDVEELLILKHKYGLSMNAWIYRASDLGIISKSVAQNHYQLFSQKGWRKREPGNPVPFEKPFKMELLARRAVAEQLISRGRASELLGTNLYSREKSGEAFD